MNYIYAELSEVWLIESGERFDESETIQATYQIKEEE